MGLGELVWYIFLQHFLFFMFPFGEAGVQIDRADVCGQLWTISGAL
jgi:hypothetical protein